MKKLTTLQHILGIVCLLSIFVGAAQAAERDTPERDGRFVAVTAGAAISAGQLVGILPADGEAYPGADTATLAIIGRAENTVAEGGTVLVKRGVFRWTNGGALTASSIGQTCYAFGVGTVTTAAIATNDAPAGVIQDVDASGVWVDTYNETLQLTSSVTALAISGAATVGTTLGVTGVATFTAETVHNLGIDADYITTDAASGIDTKTAGALKVGEATATSVEIADTGVATDIQGTLSVDEAAVFDSTVAVTGALTARVPVVPTVLESGTTRIITSADYGKMIIVTNGGAVALTLPANGAAAGSWLGILHAGSDACAPTISAASVDTLVGPNDVDLDSVTWATGHRIGAQAVFISDGSFWHVQNLGGTTMTYTD